MNPERQKGNLTSGRLLAKNTAWNLFGYAAPMAVAVFCIPMLIREMGKDRFGVLTLAWALVGYASLFDLGLGRALTQVVAKKLGAGEEHEVPRTVWTSLLLMLGLGAVGSAAVAGVSPWLVHRLLKIPGELQGEALGSFYLLAVSIPMVIVSAGLRGLLEAHQRFDLVTYVRVPLGVFTFVGPLLVLPFSKSLAPVVGVLVAGRLAGCVAFFWMCLRVAPELRQRVAWHGPSAGPLLRFGGWMTVSNVVGPMMLYMDRFVIGALVSATAVAYYATPFEVITKLFIVTGAISAVMFPAFSSAGAADPGRSLKLYWRGMASIVVLILPLGILLIVGAKEALALWLGADFAGHSYRVAQLLLIGTSVMAMEALPFVFIQGLGRPDIPAKLNLLELPFYAVALYWLVMAHGVTGAAIAWMLRGIADTALLIYFAHKLQKSPAKEDSAVDMVSAASVEL